MFKKILIANRGEIACRVIETAKKMGIKTVAIYSDADVKALHVEKADEAIHIGPSPVAESYLKGDVIIEAAKKTGAEAIHPGYGFLSENPDFVEAVTKAGLIFIGPSALSIKQMGLKDAAKKLMQDAGVPVVPGYHGESQDPEFLKAEAKKIGYPILLKARAGGGGKGMRLVEDEKNFTEALESAQREGQSSFGDAHVLIEKFITSPRHIEVQVFGDSHGNIIHLFERDCSLQRRHQKVIEEAPAPGMTEEVRKAMTSAAVKAAKAIDYEGAGTIEFIVDGSGPLSKEGFWFMEMNTRLQVEHPVTEAITGHDLVEWQIRIANGEPLPETQQQQSINGHAFEARIYAEDPYNQFLPVTGHLKHVSFGQARIDTAVRSGSEISPHYDPMIAKLTTHAKNRQRALDELKRALDDTHIAGTITNISFLSALCTNETVRQGNMDTGLIADQRESLIIKELIPEEALALASINALKLDFEKAQFGWRLWGKANHKLTFKIDEQTLERELIIYEDQSLTIQGGAKEKTLENLHFSGSKITAECEGKKCHADIIEFNDTNEERSLSLKLEGKNWKINIPNPLNASSDEQQAGNAIKAPMTGIVTKIEAKAGAKVKAGDFLGVIEAMKMEHSLTAPRDAKIKEWLFEVGSSVEGGNILVSFEEKEASQ